MLLETMELDLECREEGLRLPRLHVCRGQGSIFRCQPPKIIGFDCTANGILNTSMSAIPE